MDIEDFNWYKLFEGIENIKVEQSQWKNFEVTSYLDSGVYIDLFSVDKPLPGTKQNQKRTFKTDFISVRNIVKEPHPSRNFTLFCIKALVYYLLVILSNGYYWI